MDPGEAALRVLEEERGRDLHWTVVWDLALKRAYIDPFTQPGAREDLMRALAAGAKAGTIEKTSTGTYRAR